MSRPVLIYDASRRPFRAAARLLGRWSALSLVPWRAEAVTAFLDAQFGGRPFALVVVDLDTGVVRVGAATVAWLLRDRGVPDSLARLAARAYGPLSGPVGRLLHGRAPAPLDGTYRVTEAARPHLAALRERCTGPGCVP